MEKYQGPEKKTLKDFDGDHSAMMAYFGKFGGEKKAFNYRIHHLIPQHKRITNLALNGNLNQTQIAEITGVSQSYVCNFLNAISIKQIKNIRYDPKQKIELLDLVRALQDKYLLDELFIYNVLENNQDEIEPDFKL